MNKRGKQNTVKAMMGVMGMCVIGYIVGPPLYWQLSDMLRAPSYYCSPCYCDCSNLPLLSFPEGIMNHSFTDCMKHDPEVSEETHRNFGEMLTEELRLREAEALSIHQRADLALLEAKKLASQYQKEADKCSSGMETCEAAREKAEATLEAQKKLRGVWELRALQRGWRDEGDATSEFRAL